MSSDQILVFTDDMDATTLGVCFDRMAHPGGLEALVKDVPGSSGKPILYHAPNFSALMH
jgi:hypothetical protein